MNVLELIGLHYLGIDEPEFYIKWAEEQLAAGSDSSNMAILASMDFEKPVNKNEVVYYFDKCIEELGIFKPDEATSLKELSIILCSKILNDEMSSREGLIKLSKLYPASDYSERLYLSFRLSGR